LKVVDIALRSFLLGEKSLDMSHVLENVIYLELVRRGYEVYVGKIGDLEVDFIAMKYKDFMIYGVCAPFPWSGYTQDRIAVIVR
jgi:predicted AAA+ superfamily ATPase